MIINQQPPSGGGGASPVAHNISPDQYTNGINFYDANQNAWVSSTTAIAGCYVPCKVDAGATTNGSIQAMKPDYGSVEVTIVDMGKDVTRGKTSNIINAFYYAILMPDFDIYITDGMR